jgi:hypothetical protein
VKPLGLVMVACAILPGVWPGWATGAATLGTFVCRGVRLAAGLWAFGFSGVFSVILVRSEFGELF